MGSGVIPALLICVVTPISVALNTIFWGRSTPKLMGIWRPERYPFAQLMPCDTGCNPGNGLVCGSGRDPQFRICSKCLPNWFALDAACFECNIETPYMVLIFLPAIVVCLALYAWKRATQYPTQGAGVGICFLGLQLLTVMERFYHRNSSSPTSRDLPDVLMVPSNISSTLIHTHFLGDSTIRELSVLEFRVLEYLDELPDLFLYSHFLSVNYHGVSCNVPLCQVAT